MPQPQVNDAILIVLIGALGGGVIGPIVIFLWNRIFNKNKDSTDLAKTAFDIANQVAGEFRESQVDAKQDRLLLREYMRGTRILTAQIEEKNEIPRWFPPIDYADVLDNTPTQPDNRKPPNIKRGGFGGMKR